MTPIGASTPAMAVRRAPSRWASGLEQAGLLVGIGVDRRSWAQAWAARHDKAVERGDWELRRRPARDQGYGGRTRCSISLAPRRATEKAEPALWAAVGHRCPLDEVAPPFAHDANCVALLVPS